MDARCTSSAALFAYLLGSVAALSACNPTPDYRIELRNIPASAELVLIGWKSESDVVSSKSLAVPIAGLSEESRQRTHISLELLDAPESTGVLSVAVVNRELCLTAVATSEPVTRSSGAAVSMVAIDLDPVNNPRVGRPEPLPSPPPQCPPNPQVLPYPVPLVCHRLPGLSAIPTEPMLIPTRPVVIASIRQYKGPARVFNEGGFALYGWGFDRPKIAFGPLCDPANCLYNLGRSYPEFAFFLSQPFVFSYPEVRTVGYGELALDFAAFKDTLGGGLPSSFVNGALLCLSVSAASFSLINQDSASTTFAEPYLGP